MRHLSFPVVILAGGLATRLRPLTEACPKSLIDIHGEPFIIHQLRLLQKNHISQVVLCVGYLGEQIVDLIGDGSQFNINVTYSFDGDILLGTAGAIKKALPLLTETFFVLYGDSYLPCDYQAIQNAFLQQDKSALMGIYKNQHQWDTSNIEYIANQIVAYDKKYQTERMEYIDYGVSILQKKVFETVPYKQFYDLAELYQTLIQKQEMAAFEVPQRFYEIGSWNGIQALKDYIKTS